MIQDELSWLGLNPVKIDKRGPLYKKTDVEKTVANQINANDYFYVRAKIMTADLMKAIETTDTAIDVFSKKIDEYYKIETKIIAAAKSSSGAIRDASEKLGQGVIRIEKAANFNRLEQYVLLLERANAAMQGLAELEKDGKLEKIASAIR